MDRTTGMYTLGHEKTCHYISDYNSHVYLWIFYTSINGKRKECSRVEELKIIYHFTLHVSTLVDKTKKTYNSTF